MNEFEQVATQAFDYPVVRGFAVALFIFLLACLAWRFTEWP